LATCCLVLLISGVTALTSYSQAVPVQGDSISPRYTFRSEFRYPFSNTGVYSPLYLSDPSNIKREIVYDPETGRYIFTEKAGTLDLRPPSSMSIDEYYRYINSTSVTDYWLSRSRQTKTAGSELFPAYSTWVRPLTMFLAPTR